MAFIEKEMSCWVRQRLSFRSRCRTCRRCSRRAELSFLLLTCSFQVFPREKIGWGTMISSFMGDKCSPLQFFIGLIQFIFCWTIVMWIASIYWGILLVKKER
eukprot:TRINITY_DN12435_c0_g2_i1.p1 TRINITY_DN12435_c0_g2~~TRINITY_DN12435_c0_g2_i1.p1  ORF type:complete len:102 (+),score=2.05 TRINITY_DN12435_c0_g2_i1:122-427(+)